MSAGIGVFFLFFYLLEILVIMQVKEREPGKFLCPLLRDSGDMDVASCSV